MIPKTEQENLRQLQSVIKSVYAQAKAASKIPTAELPVCERAIAQAYALYGKSSKRVWRRIRRRVAARYWREHGRPIRGIFDWDIDWEAILEWLLDNIVPILKMFIMFAPLFLENGPKR